MLGLQAYAGQTVSGYKSGITSFPCQRIEPSWCYSVKLYVLGHQYQAWHVNSQDFGKGIAYGWLCAQCWALLIVVVTIVRAAMTGVGLEHCIGLALEPFD